MIKIKNDLYDIAWRLKAIDKAYEIFYNDKKHWYEIWSDGFRQLVIPYKNLDIRTIKFVKKTRIENYKKLIAEIDAHNTKITARRNAELKDKQQIKIKNLVNYLDKGKSYIPNYEEL